MTRSSNERKSSKRLRSRGGERTVMTSSSAKVTIQGVEEDEGVSSQAQTQGTG